jgi:hypothetical protein
MQKKLDKNAKWKGKENQKIKCVTRTSSERTSELEVKTFTCKLSGPYK